MNAIISGEKLQLLSEVGFCGEFDDIKNNQLKQIKHNVHLIESFLPDNIRQYKTIFIYTDFTKQFFEKFEDHLSKDTIIITHNSDGCVDENYLKYINNTNIKKWFCQNRLISHPKLISLPIGIANSQWPHGDQELLIKIRAQENKKNNLVYKNFDIGTNFNERTYCNQVTHDNGIIMSGKCSQEKYLENISKAAFIISPPGNGLDCHRIWESLLLRTVPVVKYHEGFSQFKHLPILFVDRWEDVTIQFLRDKVNSYNIDWDIPELTMAYWKKQLDI